MVAETGENLFAASKITHCLASETGGASIHHGFSIRSRAFHELPNFLKGKGYRNVDSALDAPFQKAFNTDMMCFPWMEKHPEHIAAFHTHVPIFQSPQPWPSVLPLKDMLGDTDAKTPIFVDVGGGHGKRSVDFRDAVEAHGISGRIINQDLPKTIEMAPKHRGIEMMEQDMFEEQKIKGKQQCRQRLLATASNIELTGKSKIGARFYYLRAVLHDHPDAKAKAILQRIKEAMDPHSILLIDDLVIPSKGASRVVVQMDITMMALCGAKERTETEWRKLLGDVGFEMRKVHRYHPEIEFAVMEAVVAKT